MMKIKYAKFKIYNFRSEACTKKVFGNLVYGWLTKITSFLFCFRYQMPKKEIPPPGKQVNNDPQNSGNIPFTMLDPKKILKKPKDQGWHALI